MEIIKKTVLQQVQLSGADFSADVSIIDNNIDRTVLRIGCSGQWYNIEITSEDQIRDLVKELGDLVQYIDYCKHHE